jgi:tetratricopeptide (TPR) repeat protein
MRSCLLMSKVSSTILVLLCSILAASACFWITGTTYDGQSKRTSGLTARHLRKFLSLDHREQSLKMQSALARSTNFNDRSDYAVSLVYAGKTEEAVELLQTLEKEQPGAYVIAANLGTALELLGKNEEALHWITEGIRRNPQSHEGTEWLHAKILEAKIAQEKDADYFKKHSVLELDPTHVPVSLRVANRSFSPTEVGSAIQYQLQERLQFVKPPDPAVASLLFDYAAIEAATGILESAEELLKMAVEYGYPAERVEAQIKAYDHKIAARKIKGFAFYTFLIASPILGLFYLYRVGIFVLSSKDLKSRA